MSAILAVSKNKKKGGNKVDDNRIKKFKSLERDETEKA